MGKAINVSGGTLTAKDHAAINNAMANSNGIAETFGHKMNHRLDSVNKIAILDGFAMVQGRCYVIYPGDEESLTIKNGSQGMERHDLIVLEFNNSLEELKIKILNGTENPSNPVDPTLTQDDTLSGGNIYQMPLYRIVVNGLSVSVEDLREYLKVGGGLEYTDLEPVDITVSQWIDIVYPVGSIYLSADSTNPAQKFMGTTWQLVGSKLAVRENVIGNGKTLGITDGTKYGNLGLNWNNNNKGDLFWSTKYGENVNSSTQGSATDSYTGNLGVPTKSQLGTNLENSGLIVDTETIYSWKRTA